MQKISFVNGLWKLVNIFNNSFIIVMRYLYNKLCSVKEMYFIEMLL